MIETLGKLFGSQSRVKIMRLFLQNEDATFDAKDVSERSRVRLAEVRREANQLVQTGLLKKKQFTKVIEGKRLTKRIKCQGFVLNQEFELLAPLRELVVEASVIRSDQLVKKLRPAGKIKLLIVAGVFTHDSESRLDLLVVGDNLRRSVIESTVRQMEAETGKELAYAVFETPEFKYRIDMYDKLVCDVIEYPHEKLIDMLGIISGKIRA